MKNFKLIKEHIDTKPFLMEVAAYEDYWDTERARALEVQRETLSLPLIQGVSEDGKQVIDSSAQEKTHLYDRFPYTTAWLETIAQELKSSLCRVNIISLKPEGRVYGHRDMGEYYKSRHRYHLVLQSKKGTKMIVGDEEQTMREGEVWWFDNKQRHEVFNLSTDPRIHMVFDLLPGT